MRWILVLCLLVSGCLRDAEARGPGSRHGVRRNQSRVSGGAASPLEDPTAGTAILFVGQSLADGLNGGVGLSTTPSATDFIVNASNSALCALQAGTGCGFDNTEKPIYGAINEWRSLRGAGAPIIGIQSAVGGTTIAQWASGTANFIQAFTTDVGAAVTLTTANAGTLGYDHIAVRIVVWIQGESDFANATYGASLTAMLDAACTAIQAQTSQAFCPTVLLLPPSTWNAANAYSAPPHSVLDQVDVAIARADVHVLDVKYAEPYEIAATPLHLTNAGYRHMGQQIGKAAYRILEQGDGEYGLLATSAAASGSAIQVCFDTPVSPLVLDTTTCPAHGNGSYGLEYYQAEAGAPTISSVAVNGTNTNCLDLTMSGAVRNYTGRYLRGAYTAASVIGTHQGCQTAGYPYTNVHDSDSTTLVSGGNAYNWAVPFNQAITGGASRGATQSTGYFRFNVNNEALNLADNASLEVGAHATWGFWMREGSLTNSARVALKNASWDFLTWHSGGFDGLRLYLNNPAWNARFYTTSLATIGTWVYVVIVYDGTQSTAATRLRTWYDCLEASQVGPSGTSPTSLADNANALQINASASGHPNLDTTMWAMWNTSATLAQVGEICQGTATYASTTLGQPVVEARPDSDDTVAGTITNYGSYSTAWTPTNMEADDVVQGGGP